MANQMQILYGNAKLLLQRLATSQGLQASTIASDNYKRVWARDSVICGIAGILAEDDLVVDSLKQSLLTLAKHQNKSGIIPSNVLEKDNDVDVSYGSLVGRVDTNTWFIIGACLHFLNTNDVETFEYLKLHIERARIYLKTIELNGKGWIYTPLSGNWADEYPIDGYTLYDNTLRIWGERLWLKILQNPETELNSIVQKTRINFWPKAEENSALIYKKEPFLEASKNIPNHFCASISPAYYNMRFDCAGNALALLNFDLSGDEKSLIETFIQSLNQQFSKQLIPAFWPVIKDTDWEWNLLKNNYSFDFKNKPHYFHNGGIWPVWMGLFCLGLAKQGLSTIAEKTVSDFVEFTTQDNWNFQEYIDSKDFQLNGKHEMGFTASGIVFMYHALHSSSFKTKLGL